MGALRRFSGRGPSSVKSGADLQQLRIRMKRQDSLVKVPRSMMDFRNISTAARDSADELSPMFTKSVVHGATSRRSLHKLGWSLGVACSIRSIRCTWVRRGGALAERDPCLLRSTE